MYNKSSIIELLTKESFYVDDFIFDAFIRSWKIEPIYEDENGVEYYDDDTLGKIRDGLIGKSPKKAHIKKTKARIKEEVKKEITKEVAKEITNELSGILDNSFELNQSDKTESSDIQDIIEIIESDEDKDDDFTEIIEAKVDDIQVPAQPQETVKQKKNKKNEHELIIENVVDDQNKNIKKQKTKPNKTKKNSSLIKRMTEQIEEITTPIITEKELAQNEVESEISTNVEVIQKKNELRNLKVDISSQTLSLLAGALAQKISSEVATYLQKSDFIEKAVNTGELKSDNKVLQEKINEMVSDNKFLIQKIQQLENENAKYVKLVGNVYIKTN